MLNWNFIPSNLTWTYVSMYPQLVANITISNTYKLKINNTVSYVPKNPTCAVMCQLI